MKKFLKKKKIWNKKKSYKIAQHEGIKLKKIHWKIILFSRKFYFKFNKTLSIRLLLKAINHNSKKKIDSIDLFKLFSKNPLKKISKIAGIPEPEICL